MYKIILLATFLLGFLATAQSQNHLINGINTQIVCQHISVELKLDYPKAKKLKIEGAVSILSRNKGIFSLRFNRLGTECLKISDGDQFLDSLCFEVKDLNFEQFVRCEGLGLIKEGTHSKEVLQKMQSVEMIWNMPWLKGEVSSFNLEIYNDKGEILYSKFVGGNNFNDAEIQFALAQLTRGSVILIQRVGGKTPYDDGHRPQNMTFYCK